MKRRTFLLQGIAAATMLAAGRGWAAPSATPQPEITPLMKTKDEWRKLLDPAAYKVLFEEDTERPNTSALLHETRDGHFVCAACYLPLFKSSTKFESGTGWPSFFDPLPNAVATHRDFKLVWPRIEYHCARCGGHQGHVFDDGPLPTGKRYCNNGLALNFVPSDQTLPALRT
jgi:peptide-methionine (R)-S-oxide reductase